MDGNGRMGRLWQTVILRQYSPVFEFLPIEAILGESDNQGDSTGFVEFMLLIINDSLEDLLTDQNVNLTDDDNRAAGRRAVVMGFAPDSHREPSGQFYHNMTTSFHLPRFSPTSLDNFDKPNKYFRQVKNDYQIRERIN